MKSFDKTLAGWHSAILGHNRSMTEGGLTVKNCHPFYHTGAYSNGILGMHNGTITYESKLRMKDSSFGTDSECIIKNIAEEGPEATLAKIGGTSSYTLVWYDVKDHSINMTRNEKRPLIFMFDKDNKTMYFGSEVYLLQAALGRNGRAIEKCYQLGEMILYKWIIPTKDLPFAEPTETKVEGYKSPLVAYLKPSAAEVRRLFKGGGSSGTGPPNLGPVQNKYKEPAFDPTTANHTLTGQTGWHLTPELRTSGPFKGMISYGVVKGFSVYRDVMRNLWCMAEYSIKTTDWTKHFSKTAPVGLPFNRLDINSQHCFKHVGKKKKKTIYFVGWEGKYLTREETENHFSYGCSCCTRQPEWGNLVTWLNAKHDFLCEYCSLDAPMLKAWRAIG